jgi:nitroreductase
VVARGFLAIYLTASAAWLASLFVSPLLGALLNIPAAYGFLLVARGFEEWSRERRHMSYVLSALVSRGVAGAVVVLSLGAALLLATEPMDTGGARMGLYALWCGLWILYYIALMDRLDDLGIPTSRHPVTITALSASILLSPIATEGFPAPTDVKLALATALYAGYMPPFNTVSLLAALLAKTY